MLEDESQNLDHLAVAAPRLKHSLLQSSEGGRQFGERRAVAECARFALNDRQAAWTGLVPRQYTTGGRPRLDGIAGAPITISDVR